MHVRLGQHGSEHLPSLHAIIDYINDRSKTSDIDRTSPAVHGQHGQSISPRFNVRETANAFFLEGELPGVGDRSKVSLQRIGERDLMIEADSSQLDIEREWGEIEVRNHAGEQTHVNKSEENGIGQDRTDIQLVQSVGEASQGSKPDLTSNEVWAGKHEGLKSRHVECLLAERQTGHLQRLFTFPVAVEFDQIRARLKDGLLKIIIPKAATAQCRETLHIEMED